MTYPHYISTAIFFANIFRPSTGIFPLIKCKKSCIFIVEYFPSSECSTIFASIWQSSTAFGLYTAYTRIIPRIMSKLVWTCQSTLMFVEACRIVWTLIFSLYYSIPLYMKIIQRIVQQISTKFAVFIIAHFNWNVKKNRNKSFDNFFAW